MKPEERIARLEAQIDKLEAKQADLHKQVTQAEIEQWQGRIEDLEVQLHLGAMDANDKLNGLVDQLRSRWAEARGQLEGALPAATDAFESVRGGLTSAFKDVRQALLDTKHKAAP
jgi:predicted nuclease with TOPRIM domain